MNILYWYALYIKMTVLKIYSLKKPQTLIRFNFILSSRLHHVHFYHFLIYENFVFQRYFAIHNTELGI